eukprot:TRINITY_DN1096_c0_g1_i1.p1 TRINITY_DN1096_c0_g1~~TRINITY_DN1096_c0_g1_i1.p1  ORF type:complete len:134 (-),score=17.40 TRINITY_DN1096_c0_g1_i1:86-487(-)
MQHLSHSRGTLISLKIIITLLVLGTIGAIAWAIVVEGSFWKSKYNLPWVWATLADFYTNQMIVYLWIFYKEKKHWMLRILWLVLVLMVGSMATGIYVLIQFFRLKPNDPLYRMFLNDSDYRYNSYFEPVSLNI